MIDRHVEVRSTIDGERGKFEGEPTEHRMSDMLDGFPLDAMNVVVTITTSNGMRQEIDIRYVVTSLKGSAEHLYEDRYCGRGQMEMRRRTRQINPKRVAL